MLQISEIVRKTEGMFDLFNEHFYEGELSRPAITVLCPKTCHRQPSFLKNGIRKAGNLFKDFLLGSAAGGRLVFSFESLDQIDPMGYNLNSYLKSKRTLS